MTIKEARKVLGKKAEGLSDEELLEKMVKVDRDLEDFFQGVLKEINKKKSKRN